MMANKKNESGVILTHQVYLRIKAYGPASTISSLILSNLSRLLPETAVRLRESLGWTQDQCYEVASRLGENPFPFSGDTLFEVGSPDQLRLLEKTTFFEQISLEYHCFREGKGVIHPPPLSRDKGKAITLRMDISARNWWERQFSNTQPGISHVLMAATDWILITIQEDIFVQLEQYKEILHKALADVTIPGASEEIKQIVKSKVLTIAQGSVDTEVPTALVELLNKEIPEFVYLCLILKYGYGNNAKKTVSPRITANSTDFLVSMFGNKNTGVAYAAETFPYIFHTIVYEEILPCFTVDEIETLRVEAKKNNIGPQSSQYPGRALNQLAAKLSPSYRDRIKKLSPVAKLCLEVAVVARNFVKDGPLVKVKERE